MTIKVLINDSFKKYLLTESKQNREKIKQKFEFLEIGCWDGGLKVKKIRGVTSAKTIFEGRLDKANRILFTLGSDEHPEEKNTLLVYIWGIVTHDEISNKTKNILPDNVPFIHFKPFREEMSDELYFDKIDQENITQESITKKVSDDSGSQKWYPLSEEEWNRVQLYIKDDFELYLQLTPAQSELLKTPPPIMLSGTAGSGKTTLSVYYLLKGSLGHLDKLFVTYNSFLKNMAEKLYSGLLNSSLDAEKINKPKFYAYKNLCLDIVEKFNRTYRLENEVDYYKFCAIVRPHSLASKYDMPLIWEEIRSIIKGALPQINIQFFKETLTKAKQNQLTSNLINSLHRQLVIFSNLESSPQIEKIVQKYFQTNLYNFTKNLKFHITDHSERIVHLLEKIIELLLKQRDLTQKRYLSFLEYEMLGRKKAPNFKHDRKNIYKIFEFYQDKLDRENLWDEIDLSKDVINILIEKNPKEYMYDLVVCDEVQDLTDTQHELLFYLIKNPLNLLLTGDTKQIINPSGFRWEELKRHFFERNLPTPEVMFLNLNFRSSGNIVELANTLLELKANLLGTSAEELKEDWKYKGRPPVIAHSITEKEMLENLRGIGAKKTILVRNEKEKEKLKRIFETELIFTIYEAKGLEFDSVFIWNFCSDIKTKDVWVTILENSKHNIHDANIKHEINLLYVAITRAQKELLIYDGTTPSVIWQSDLLKDQVYQTNDLNYISGIWNVISTPEEWIEQGNYFFEREFYKAAIECFKNAGSQMLTTKAEAYYQEKIGEYYKAAVNFEIVNEIEKAAVNYELSGNFNDALRLYTQLQIKDKILQCTTKILEKEGRFAEVADIYLSLSEYEKAFDAFIKSKNYKMAAEISLNYLKNFIDAAKYYELAGEFLDAAKLYLKLKNYEHAAELFEKAEDFQNAEKLWKKLKNDKRLIKLYHITNQYEPLLSIYEKEKNFESAVKTLRLIKEGKDLKAEADSYSKKRKYFSALIRYYLINDNLGVAESAFKLKYFTDAAKYYDLAGNCYKAAESYYKLKNYTKAFINYLNSPEDHELLFKNAKKVGKYIGEIELETTASSFATDGKPLQASVCYELAGNRITAGFCQLELGNIEEAYYLWRTAWQQDRYETIATYAINNNKIDAVAKFVLRLPGDAPSLYGLQIYEYNSKLVKMMNLYFQNNHSTEKIAHWVRILKMFDFDFHYAEDVLRLYEKAGNYNDYFFYIAEIKKVNKPAFKNIKEKFKSEYANLKESVSETSAIKLYFIGKKDQYNLITKKLAVTKNNYSIFIESSKFEETLRYLIDNNMMRDAISLSLKKSDFSSLAKIQEEKGLYIDAAYSYNLAGEFIKSAELYLKGGDKESAAKMFTIGGKHKEALDIYLQMEKKDHNKIAELYEKLGNYKRAGEIYLMLRNPKKAARCFKKASNQTLF
ncbi:MAG: UvrD-helicase domain-containing protein [Bacteroidetes bacterium]|nr:UvrD-helicase domain-containing protein [Bacteroidota bacterium]MBU2584428.1 UvrD-helicase domain-containing protein [Bacteroidota bacterium]